jgi:hypothetical protein
MNLGMAYASNIDDVMQINEPESIMAISTQVFPL